MCLESCTHGSGEGGWKRSRRRLTVTAIANGQVNETRQKPRTSPAAHPTASRAVRPRSGRGGSLRPRSGGFDVEVDALGQGEGVAAVDRAGLAAHVGLPRVRARLATAAGGLLAAERAADLGARGADVDVGDPAVRSLGREEPLGLPQVVGEDGGGQPLVDRVVDGDAPRRGPRRASRRGSGRTSPRATIAIPGRARTTAGSTKNPGRSSRSPPRRTSPPCSRAAWRARPIAATARSLISGPTSTPSSDGSPIVRLRYAATSRARKPS